MKYFRHKCRAAPVNDLDQHPGPSEVDEPTAEAEAHEPELENNDDEELDMSMVPADDDLIELEPVNLGARPREPAVTLLTRNEDERDGQVPVAIPLSPAQWDAVQLASRDDSGQQMMEVPLLPVLEARPVSQVNVNNSRVGKHSEKLAFIMYHNV